jgi:DNA-binding response OmpR family regulator
VTSRLSSNNKKKKKILFVDDEPDMTSLLKSILEFAGFSVDIFNDSANPLNNFKPHFYDLVIIDIVIPKMDGFELLKELKKLDPDINACFLTASEQYYENLRNEEYRILDKELFIRKPISMKELLEEINKRINSS